MIEILIEFLCTNIILVGLADVKLIHSFDFKLKTYEFLLLLTNLVFI